MRNLPANAGYGGLGHRWFHMAVRGMTSDGPMMVQGKTHQGVLLKNSDVDPWIPWRLQLHKASINKIYGSLSALGTAKT